MKKKGRACRQAFTLVELIVSLTIFAMLLGGVYYALGVELNLWKRISASVETQQIGNMLLSRIVRDIREAKEILPASNKERLLLKIGSDIIEYSLTSGKVKRKKNAYTAYLTAEKQIQALAFYYPAPRLIEIKVENFTTKACLRN